MKRKRFMEKEIVKRYEHNPILTPDNMPIPCNSVFNPGAIKHRGKYLLILRIEDYDRISHFRIATSDDGVHFDVDEEPMELPQDPECELYETNCYDARISKIDDIYYITYAAESRLGVRIGLMKTVDFKKFERMPYGSEVENRNGVLFPEKIEGLYARLDRPLNHYGEGHIWISYSPDLVFWGKAKLVMKTRWHSWDEQRIGAAGVPIKTDHGWLLIYHGVCRYTRVYELGACLLDLKDPAKAIARSKHSILGPKEIYERVGEVPNVVFSNGAVVEDDGEVKIYYGGADHVVCLATAKLDDLIRACFEY